MERGAFLPCFLHLWLFWVCFFASIWIGNGPKADFFPLLFTKQEESHPNVVSKGQVLDDVLLEFPVLPLILSPFLPIAMSLSTCLLSLTLPSLSKCHAERFPVSILACPSGLQTVRSTQTRGAVPTETSQPQITWHCYCQIYQIAQSHHPRWDIQITAVCSYLGTQQLVTCFLILCRSPFKL